LGAVLRSYEKWAFALKARGMSSPWDCDRPPASMICNILAVQLGSSTICLAGKACRM
jgi:hypothetical protein